MKLFISILCLFLFVTSVNPADSATWTVNNLADFQARLTEAQNNGQNDTINVSAGIYDVAATLIYQPVEARTLTIQGASAATTILDGGNSFQMMNIDTSGVGSGADVTIRGLTFRNGSNGAGSGGALFVDADGATISIDNCIFSNNTANGSGGAARMNAGANGTVYFENNMVGGTNSAATAAGGAIYINTAENGTLYVRNNSITGTNTSGGGGGAIRTNTGNGGMSIISGNSLSGTNTGTRGGGIFANTSSNCTLTISKNTISGTNTASSIDGGGIYANTGSDSTLTFSGNTIFGNNTASTTGGGAHINGGSGTTITVVNNTIGGTNSASEDGGGLRVNSPSNGLLYLVNNTVTGNTAANYGGGVYIPSSGTANIYNNIIRDNAAGEGGNDGDDLYVETDSGNETNLFNNILGPDSDFITANSEDLVITDITLYSQGSNSTADPMLGPLQNNGGPTFTRALPDGSTAINTGDNTIVALLGISTDQRGYPRIVNAVVDIGAYEFGSSLAIPALTDWGIIVFLTLAGFGSVYFLRRQRGTGN